MKYLLRKYKNYLSWRKVNKAAKEYFKSIEHRPKYEHGVSSTFQDRRYGSDSHMLHR